MKESSMADLILRENLDGTDFSDVSDGIEIPPVTPGEVSRTWSKQR